MSDPKTVFLRGNAVYIDGEVEAAKTIVPGQLIEESAAGEWQPHSTAGANAQKAFAMEQELIGNGIDTDIDAGEKFTVMFPAPGSEIYAWLDDGETAVVGNALVSAGEGSLDVYAAQAVDEGGAATYTIYDQNIVAYAVEDVDNSLGATPVRIRVRVA